MVPLLSTRTSQRRIRLQQYASLLAPLQQLRLRVAKIKLYLITDRLDFGFLEQLLASTDVEVGYSNVLA